MKRRERPSRKEEYLERKHAMPVDQSVVDRECLRRIYQKFQPDKVSDIDNILAKRSGNRQAMSEVFDHLGKRYAFDAMGLRQTVEKEMQKTAGGGAIAAPASPAGAKKTSPAPAPAASVVSAPSSPAGTQKKPSVMPTAGGAAAPAASATNAPSPNRGGGGPGSSAAGAGGGGTTTVAASPSSTLGAGGSAALEAATVVRVARFLNHDPKAVPAESQAKAEMLVKNIASKGLNERSATQLIKQLEKRLGWTEADMGVVPPTAASTGAGRAAAAAMTGDGTASGGAGSGAMRRSLSTLLHDAFGIAPDQRTVPIRRAAMTAEERAYYELLLLPSVKMACSSGAEAAPETSAAEVQEALDEIFKRCESGVLPASVAAEVRTARDVADRVVRALQGKYELRNPAGKNDFFAKFIPGNAHRSALAAAVSERQRQQHQQPASTNGFSLDSNPTTVSRLIAHNTLASSMFGASVFLGGDEDLAASEARMKEAAGSTVSDLGPLPADMTSGQVGDGKSFSALLSSAMKFLDSSSAEAADPAAALALGGARGVPQSDKEILHATFSIEFLTWTDVASASNAARDRFKLAVAQDVADVLGWGELFQGSMPFSGGTVAGVGSIGAGAGGGGALGRHSWRNVIVKKFSHSTAGNVHAECNVIVPAGISVDDLKSLVYTRLRSGGFPMMRSRVSLSRDMEARPAALFCATASFSSNSERHQENVVPEMVMDPILGVNVSPHKNTAMSAAWPRLPVSP